MSAEGRYIRQTLISQIGEAGQRKLAESRVTVIGCGGLGAPVLTYLALAGVGKIRMIDHDAVQLTNLNRQFFYEESHVETEKCQEASEFLRRRNSGICLEPLCMCLTGDNADELLRGSHVVVDCVDCMETRRLAGRACQRLQIPLIEGGVHGFYGFLLPVLPGKSACMECVMSKEAEEKGPVPALGAVAGVIGSLQAVEALKVLLGFDHVRYGTMLQYDGLYGEFTEVPVNVRLDCICQSL